MNFKSTQVSPPLIAAVIIEVIVLIAFMFTNTPVILIFALFILVTSTFSTLTISVDDKKLRAIYGIGIIQKSFPLEKITYAKAVRNKWHYGWGIRIWLWPRMIILNVWGLDAVEIKLENGRVFRIGTNKPKELEKAILENIK